MRDLVRDGMLVGTLTGTSYRRARHDDERHAIVPDGDRVRVPMMCMDARSLADAEAIREAAYDAYVQDLSDAWKAPPGKPVAAVQREAPATDPQAIRDAAHEAYCQRLQDAWRQPPAVQPAQEIAT